jgi:hypothetical protein
MQWCEVVGFFACTEGGRNPRSLVDAKLSFVKNLSKSNLAKSELVAAPKPGTETAE